MSELTNSPAGEHPLNDFDPRSLEESVLKEMHLAAYNSAAAELAGMRIVDVGCNHGYGSRILAGSAGAVVGVDLSPKAIELARELNHSANLSFELSDAGRMPFADASFDAAVSFQVIEHIEDPRPYLREIRRVLKPGGKVILTTPNRVARLAPGQRPWNKYHIREYSAPELSEALKPHFSEVALSGLYAQGALYEIERARQERKRRKHSIPYLANLPHQLAYKLDRLLGWSEANYRRRLGGLPSYRDFFYRSMSGPQSLDDALDLRADCKA